MIFLTVGNWHKGFDRLVKSIDEFIRDRIITEEVIGQIGPGSYKPGFQHRDYFSQEEFSDLVSRARLIISHAGMGTIVQSVRLSKPIIVVPRKASLGEHVDDHQLTSTKYMEMEGKVLAAYEVDDLPAKIEQANTFKPTAHNDAGDVIKIVQDFIDNIVEKKQKNIK